MLPRHSRADHRYITGTRRRFQICSWNPALAPTLPTLSISRWTSLWTSVGQNLWRPDARGCTEVNRLTPGGLIVLFANDENAGGPSSRRLDCWSRHCGGSLPGRDAESCEVG